ncbi:MAG: AMP phosphorylase [Desulfurococcaceae archaeon]|nr:AMP phosphorylase [Sulfolobales archaeon]MDW8170200.1 AMP phosphorylase [Desulfurococcaceae archaeon]
MTTYSSTRRFEVELLEVDLGSHIVVLNECDAKELGLSPCSRAKLIKADRSIGVAIATTKTMVNPGKALVNKSTASELGISHGDSVGLRPIPIPNSFNALQKRLRGQRLTQEDMYLIISDIVDHSIGEAEIASFLVSQLFYELSDEELTYLINAMVKTGSTIEFEEPAYDEHSIGGVPGNSKVALIAVPIIASAGLLIPKTSSRAITTPAGTADTMEVLARVDLTADEIRDIARRTKATLAWGGKLNLAPADDIFVSIERRLSIDPWHQMVASILSKKVAMGIDNIVIDIPVGKSAKVQEISQADRLAGLFLNQASRLKIRLKIAITFGGQPVGRSVGPALEAREALGALIERRGSKSLIEKALHIAGLVIELSGKAPLGTGFEVARGIFEKGLSYEKFKQIIEAQGGNPSVKPEEIPIGEHSYTIYSPAEGAVTHIDNASINAVARAAGAPFDKGAGVYLHAKVGYRVNKGDPILTIYSSSSVRLQDAVSLASKYVPVTVEGMLIKLLP